MALDEDSTTWDVIVIGGGPPGENAAQYAIAGSDRTAVIVEHELVGGECSYWACMPSKALLVPVELAQRARRVPGVAQMIGDAQIDVAAVLARRDSFTSHHDDSSQVKWADGMNIDVVRGHGRLVGERTVEVITPAGALRTLTARQAVVLATGTTAAMPTIPGLDQALPWISRDVTNLHEVPDRVVLIGGGVVACEAATWLVGLGASVTLLSSGSGLLERTEPFAGELVANALVDAGAMLHFGASISRIDRLAPESRGTGRIHGGEVTVEFTVNGTAHRVRADEIVVAAGRVPASTTVGLESLSLSDGATGVTDRRGFVAVDDHLEVQGVPGHWLYAIGDLNGRALLTHMGKYQGRIVGAVIDAHARGTSLDGPRFRATGPVPQVTFTDPQVASVGETEHQARERGADIETVEYEIGHVSGALLTRDGYIGRAKLVVDAHTDLLLGATFVGPDVGELVHAATVAIAGSVTVDRLWHAVPSYPTISEVWLRLLETLAEQRALAVSEPSH